MKQQRPPMSCEVRRKQSFLLSPTGQVEIKADNGAIFIEGWDRPEASLELLIRADEAIKLQQVTPEISNEKGSLRLVVKESYTPIKYDWKQGGLGITFWPAFTTVTLRLPRAMALKVQSNNGDIELKGLLGEVDALAYNGHLRFSLTRRGDQQLVAKTYNGKLILPEPLFGWREPGRRAEARLGAGTKQVVLDSYNGSVEVR
jgi:hypothetical protein